MRRTTGMAQYDVWRYTVMPGPGLRLQSGHIKLLKLREQTKQQLGSEFYLRDFHDTLLKNDAMLLDIADQVVNNYITAKKAVVQFSEPGWNAWSTCF